MTFDFPSVFTTFLSNFRPSPQTLLPPSRPENPSNQPDRHTRTAAMHMKAADYSPALKSNFILAIISPTVNPHKFHLSAGFCIYYHRSRFANPTSRINMRDIPKNNSSSQHLIHVLKKRKESHPNQNLLQFIPSYVIIKSLQKIYFCF